MPNPPTLSEFKTVVRDAFGYLGRDFAFRETEPPASQVEGDPFVVWFVNATTFVQVQGINWGFAAQVILGPVDGGTGWHATVPLRRSSNTGDPSESLETDFGFEFTGADGNFRLGLASADLRERVCVLVFARTLGEADEEVSDTVLLVMDFRDALTQDSAAVELVLRAE